MQRHKQALDAATRAAPSTSARAGTRENGKDGRCADYYRQIAGAVPGTEAGRLASSRIAAIAAIATRTTSP